MRFAGVDIKPLFGSPKFARCLIANRVQNTNVMAYFVLQTVGSVLNIGLRKILGIVKEDLYASIAGMR